MDALLGKRILVIEDDAHIAEGLDLYLSLQGFVVRIAQDGVSGLEHWRTWKPDLVILDIMLPGMDGLSLLKKIREMDERIPVLILSAKSATDDKVKGLACGVDDYLAKPFNLDEFLLRVERLLTRAAWYTGTRDGEEKRFIAPLDTFEFGGNQIDFTAYTAVGVSGKISLTEQEVKLLKLFISHSGKPLSRDKLLEVGWGYSREVTTRTIDNFIVRFRKYFEKNPRNPIYFKSLRSVGYEFDPDGRNPTDESG